MTRLKKTVSRSRYWPRLLFLIPFVAVLWVPFYNAVEPQLGGVPLFYWYQLAWILLAAAVVFLVHLIETRLTRTAEISRKGLEVADVPGDIL